MNIDNNYYLAGSKDQLELDKQCARTAAIVEGTAMLSEFGLEAINIEEKDDKVLLWVKSDFCVTLMFDWYRKNVTRIDVTIPTQYMLQTSKYGIQQGSYDLCCWNYKALKKYIKEYLKK